jgi:hypothetical protein
LAKRQLCFVKQIARCNQIKAGSHLQRYPGLSKQAINQSTILFPSIPGGAKTVPLFDLL